MDDETAFELCTVTRGWRGCREGIELGAADRPRLNVAMSTAAAEIEKYQNSWGHLFLAHPHTSIDFF